TLLLANDFRGIRMERLIRLVTLVGVATALTLAIGVGALQVNAGSPQDAPQPPKKDASPSKPAPPKLGLLTNDPKAFQGDTLLTSMMSTKTYLIDMHGRVVRTWESDCQPALTAYLLENGHLSRPGTLGKGQPAFGGPPGFGGGPGAGGRVQEFTWEGEI